MAEMRMVPFLGDRRLRVCVDAGHGGSDPGAVGLRTREADTVLAVALRLAEELSRAGAEVVLTRAADQTTPLEVRTATAAREQTHCLISLHANSSEKPGPNGVETYYDAASGQAKALANTVHQSYLSFASGHKNRGVMASPGPEYPRRLHVLAKAGRPAILVELEFINLPAMESWMVTENFRSGAAFAICRGILQWARSQSSFREVAASAS